MNQRIDELPVDRQGLVAACERVLRPLEGVQNARVVGVNIGRARIDGQRAAEHSIRFGEIASLRRDQAEKMQRIELIGVGCQHASVRTDCLSRIGCDCGGDL